MRVNIKCGLKKNQTQIFKKNYILKWNPCQYMLKKNKEITSKNWMNLNYVKF